MIVSLTEELRVEGVFDRNVPNKERIVMHAYSSLNLGQFGIMRGVKTSEGNAFPIKDNLLWLGDGYLLPGDWVFVFTGPGEPRVTELPNTNERLISMHWGRQKTILYNEALVPILFKIEAVHIPIPQPLLSNQGTGHTA